MKPSERIHLSVASWHEAGHLVMALHEGLRVVRARVSGELPGNGAVSHWPLGPTRIDPTLGPGNARLAWEETLSRTRTRMRVSLAGPVAEARALGTPLRSLCAEHDFKSAFRLANRLLVLWEAFGVWQAAPRPVPLDLLNEQRRWVARWLARPRSWSLVACYARALERHRHLNADQIWSLYEQHAAPPDQAPLPWGRLPFMDHVHDGLPGDNGKYRPRRPLKRDTNCRRGGLQWTGFQKTKELSCLEPSPAT